MKRKYYRKTKKNILKKIIGLFIIIILVFFILTRIYLRSPILIYAKQKSYYYASLLINDAISTQIVPYINTDKIINLETKSGGYVTSVIIDVYEINLLISKMTKEIQNTLIEYQNDENHELNKLKVPFGAIFNNPLLIGVGPDLNIDLKMVGSVYSDIVSTAKPYGINNSLIEINILTRVKFQVAIPFQKDEIEVETHTPLLIKVIQGSVPHYYYIGGGSGGVVNPPPKNDSGVNDDLLE